MTFRYRSIFNVTIGKPGDHLELTMVHTNHSFMSNEKISVFILFLPIICFGKLHDILMKPNANNRNESQTKPCDSPVVSSVFNDQLTIGDFAPPLSRHFVSTAEEEFGFNAAAVTRCVLPWSLEQRLTDSTHSLGLDTATHVRVALGHGFSKPT